MADDIYIWSDSINNTYREHYLNISEQSCMRMRDTCIDIFYVHKLALSSILVSMFQLEIRPCYVYTFYLRILYNFTCAEYIARPAVHRSIIALKSISLYVYISIYTLTDHHPYWCPIIWRAESNTISQNKNNIIFGRAVPTDPHRASPLLDSKIYQIRNHGYVFSVLSTFSSEYGNNYMYTHTSYTATSRPRLRIQLHPEYIAYMFGLYVWDGYINIYYIYRPKSTNVLYL